MSKKNKIREEGGLVKKERNDKVGVRLLISFILTIMLIVAIVIVKDKLTDKEPELTIIKTKQNITENFLVSEENFADYFEIEDIAESDLPEEAIVTKKDLLGKVFTTSISKNTVVTEKYVVDENDILDTMKNPIIAGIAMDDTGNMVNGILRSGDIVDLIFYADRSHIYVIENVYIAQVFDSNGKEITRKDKETAVSKMNVYIEADYAVRFAEHIQNDVVYINKVNYDISESLFIPSDKDLIKVPVTDTVDKEEGNSDSLVDVGGLLDDSIFDDSLEGDVGLNYDDQVDKNSETTEVKKED